MSNETTTTVTAPATGGSLALPQDVLAQLADAAKAAAATERPAVGRIGLQSGQMTYAGTPVTGNKIEAVLLLAAYRNVYYAGRFDRNNIKPPNCFALAMHDKGMAPHPNVLEPASDACATCDFDAWGSDPNGGRGKACKQSRRVVLLPASALSSPDDVKKAELAVLDIPVTSVKNYSNYVNILAASASVPPYAAVTEISVVPDAKTQFKVNFTPLRVVPSIELLDAIKSRFEMAEKIALTPYEETASADSNDPEHEATPAKGTPVRTGKSKF